jgi:hypothetical protein
MTLHPRLAVRTRPTRKPVQSLAGIRRLGRSCRRWRLLRFQLDLRGGWSSVCPTLLCNPRRNQVAPIFGAVEAILYRIELFSMASPGSVWILAGHRQSVPSSLTRQPTSVCDQAEGHSQPAAGQTPKTARSQPVLAHQRLDIFAQSRNFQSTKPLVERQLTLRRRSHTSMVGQKGCLKFLYTAIGGEIPRQ